MFLFAILDTKEPPWGILHNRWKVIFFYSANSYNDGNQNLLEFSLANSHFSGCSEKTFESPKVVSSKHPVDFE